MNPELSFEPVIEVAEQEPDFSCEEQLGAVALCASCPLLRLLGDCPKIIREDFAADAEYTVLEVDLETSSGFEDELLPSPIEPVNHEGEPSAIALINSEFEVEKENTKNVPTEKESHNDEVKDDGVQVVTREMLTDKPKKTKRQPAEQKPSLITKKKSKRNVDVKIAPKKQDDTAKIEVQQLEKRAYYEKLLFDDSVPIVSVWHPIVNDDEPALVAIEPAPELESVEAVRVDDSPIVSIEALPPVIEVPLPSKEISLSIVPSVEAIGDAVYSDEFVDEDSRPPILVQSPMYKLPDDSEELPEPVVLKEPASIIINPIDLPDTADTAVIIDIDVDVEQTFQPNRQQELSDIINSAQPQVLVRATQEHLHYATSNSSASMAFAYLYRLFGVMAVYQSVCVRN